MKTNHNINLSFLFNRCVQHAAQGLHKDECNYECSFIQNHKLTNNLEILEMLLIIQLCGFRWGTL